MSVLKSAEESLEMAVFIPPRVGEEDYGLFRALTVSGGKGGRAHFASLDSGLDEVLEEKMPEKNRELEGFVSSASVTRMNAIHQTLDEREAKSGYLGSNIQNAFTSASTVKASASSDASYVYVISEMVKKRIRPSSSLQEFLTDCLPVFCADNASLASHFARTPTRFSGDIEYGLVFVTTNVTGSVSIQEKSSFHKALMTGMGNQGVQVEATGENNASDERQCFGRGVVGVRGFLFHLVKSPQTQKIQFKRCFYLLNSHDKQLLDLIGRMVGKIYRRILGPKHPPPQAAFMAREYEPSGDYYQDIAALEELAEHEAFETIANAEGTNSMASMRIIGGEPDDKTPDAESKTAADPPGTCEKYTSSDNLLYKSSFGDLLRIYKEIQQNGEVNIGGYVVDAMKPVIQGRVREALPIIYDAELSGIPLCGRIPSRVLRYTENGNIMIWGVQRPDGSTIECSSGGILTAYDEPDWHVREAREYVEKNDTATIESLKNEGFFQLHPDEADADEIDPEHVKDGNVFMMGRHVLALKDFEGPDEGTK